jgi:hypothetical protein
MKLRDKARQRTEHGDWSDVVEQVCAGLAGTLRAAA